MASPTATPDDGFDLIDFIRVIWDGKYLLVALIVLAGAGGAWRALTSGDHYVARMMVASNGETSFSALGQRVNPFVAGMMPNLEDREFNQFRGMLRSYALAETLERKYHVLPRVFAESWDPIRREWVEPRGFGARITALRNALQGRPGWRAPNVDDLQEHLKDQINTRRASYSNTIFELSYSHPDRHFAIEMLGLIHTEAEAALREERRQRTLEQVRYLRKRIETTIITEYRLSLVQLLSDQDKQMMLLESNLPLATLVLDPVSAPVRPKGIGLTTSVGIAVVGATALGVLLLLIRRLGSAVIARNAGERLAVARPLTP
jgi:hypothetical protein